jgi:hypothetical protein
MTLEEYLIAMERNQFNGEYRYTSDPKDLASASEPGRGPFTSDAIRSRFAVFLSREVLITPRQLSDTRWRDELRVQTGIRRDTLVILHYFRGQ